jgi:hypothetical protein
MAASCRCGHSGEGPHPCHFAGYSCRAPASARFVAVPGASLAGVQMKVSAYETFACDECWEKYKAMRGAES